MVIITRRSPFKAAPTPDACFRYGAWLGARWRNRHNLVWVVGGDTPWSEGDLPYFRALARGIRRSNASQLLTFHPWDLAEDIRTRGYSANDQLAEEEWLDFVSIQSHGAARQIAEALRDSGQILNSARRASLLIESKCAGS